MRTPAHLLDFIALAAVLLAGSVKVNAAEKSLPPNNLTAAEKKAGWRLLFNGQSLAGGKASEDPASFSVRDGMIVAHACGTAIPGQGVPHSKCHLFYVGPDGRAAFTDFEFQADVKSERLANSGIYFHTEFVTNVNQ